MNLKERWICAMCKVPSFLVGYRGYTEQEAALVCRCFREHPPEHLRLKEVLALEADVAKVIEGRKLRDLPILQAEVIPVKPKVVPPNIDDYIGPWCKVIKDGKLVRWEDAKGKAIPKELWPK